MPEKNILRNYPKVKDSRLIASDQRGISEKLKAAIRGFDYFDGERKFGYGGLIDDGRWEVISRDIITEYSLDSTSSILQINCEKGFLLESLAQFSKSKKIFGTESSSYAIAKSKSRVNYSLTKTILPSLPFSSKSMSLVISLGNVYTLGLSDAYKHLSEINRVSQKYSFVTLATYENEDEYWLFRKWSLLANLILKRNEWIELMKLAGYTGDYAFVDAFTLGLKNKSL